MKAAQLDIFGLARVRAHRRRGPHGAAVVVREHIRRTTPAEHEQMPLFPPGRPHTPAWAGVIDFASGSNHAGEIRGLFEAKHAIGLAAPEVNAAAERELVRLAGTGRPVFIDSGAFSEVAFGPNGPVDVRPLTDDDWHDRLSLYERLARTLGRQLYVVAPDKVGDQQATLARMSRYRHEIEQIKMFGAHILAPIQKGSMSMADFDRAVEATLGHGDYVRAIPMKKDATTLDDLVAFLQERRPRRVHLLGLGSASRSADAVLKAVKTAVPGIVITMDSNKIVAKAGRTGGKGDAEYPDPADKRRPLTVATDRAREELQQRAYLGGDGTIMRQEPGDDRSFALDYTDAIGEPSAWMSEPERRAVAAEARLSPVEAREFVRDPDGFLQSDSPSGEPWYMDESMSAAVDAAWSRYVDSQTVAEKKRRAVRSTFARGDA